VNAAQKAGYLAAFTGISGYVSNSIENLMAANAEELLDIEGIGPQTASSIKNYFQDPEVESMLSELLQIGFTFRVPTTSPDKRPFAEFIFLFTGSLESMSRDEAKVRVKERGGKVASQVSKKVTHVVVGEKPGSKMRKAEELGLTILNENDFRKLIDTKDSANNKQLSMF
jgi:DNA ligase (NAD+)